MQDKMTDNLKKLSVAFFKEKRLPIKKIITQYTKDKVYIELRVYTKFNNFCSIAILDINKTSEEDFYSFLRTMYEQIKFEIKSLKLDKKNR